MLIAACSPSMYRASALAIVAVAASVLAAGCGSSVAVLCDASCTCSECSDSVHTACVDSATKADDAASAVGCGAELSALVACTDSKGQCTGTLYTPGVCVTEAANLTKCLATGQCTISIDANLYPNIECSR
ncbi:Hypothetical protein A7982_03090 [Minicystis rosea]|nr:Hypothetical protein A7982_03090 [Minicystis rosea]